MAPTARPENVLKRADELIAVDQATAALELLYETLTSKRTRNVSVSFLEPIILRFIDLAVTLRKSRMIKDGLYQYKKLVQSTSTATLEVAVKKFIELSEAKVTEAQAQADKITLDVDEDLEAAENPEDILLSTVSSEQSKDRTDRELVTPWLKFLWEAYRASLEVLRGNSLLEVLYKNTVTHAFEFCVKYTRKTEFRRLCELLRIHLNSVSTQPRNSTAPNPINLSDPDTLQRYLDTRFSQLNVAVKLELWQEAFRSVEDVHTLLNHSKRPVKPVMMANYYENLTRIFLVSDNYLFHAAAWSKYFSLMLQARNSKEEDLRRVASSLLISTLAIPTFPQSQLRGGFQEDDLRTRNTRLTSLLNLAKNPTRESLLKQALSKNVLNYVRPEIHSLYRILEVDFHPLSIKSRLDPIITAISEIPEYKPYFKPLYNVILTRLFQQLSQVYETVKFDFVIDLATFPAPFNSTASAIEKFIVKGCHKGEFSISINHETRAITFKDDIYDESKVNSSITESASSLQLTPSQIVRTQLSRLGSTLFAVVSKVDTSFIENRDALREAAIDRALAGVEAENLETLERLKIIENRQAEAENEQRKREEEEAKNRLRKIQQEQEAEQARIAEQAAKREAERRKREEQAIRNAEKRKVAEEINSKGLIKIDIDNIDEYDTSDLKKLQIKELNKVQKEIEDKMAVIGRKNDHIERAIRLEEIPYWEKDAEKQQELDRKLNEARYQALLIKSKKDHDEKLALKKRFAGILPAYLSLTASVTEQRREEFEKIRKEKAAAFEKEKAERIREVTARREQERKVQQERNERESKELLEKNKRLREQQEALMKRKAEEKERLSSIDAAAKKQAERDAATERKLAERRAALAESASGRTGYVPPHLKKAGTAGSPASSPAAAPPARTPGAYTPPTRTPGAYAPPTRSTSGAYTPPIRANTATPPSREASGTPPKRTGYVPPSLRK